MLSRIIRATIQSGFARSKCSPAILSGPLVDKRNVTVQNIANNLASHNRFISSTFSSSLLSNHPSNRYLSSPTLSSPIANGLNICNALVGYTPTRSLTKFSMSRGKRRTVRTVLKRFYRLNWGIWIRTKAGRHKRRWTKRYSNTVRSRQHVFCNAKQSWLLDTMVSKYWRKPKYWVDDPYNPYHTREEFFLTRKNPQS